MDRLIIENATYPCTLGVTDEERSLRQIVKIDISMVYDSRKAGSTDSIADTIDYSLINKQIRELLNSKSYCLIEKMAEDVAKEILNTQKVRKIKVLVRKPFALKNAASTAIEIEREK